MKSMRGERKKFEREGRERERARGKRWVLKQRGLLCSHISPTICSVNKIQRCQGSKQGIVAKVVNLPSFNYCGGMY